MGSVGMGRLGDWETGRLELLIARPLFNKPLRNEDLIIHKSALAILLG
jgi:hypothetical protein